MGILSALGFTKNKDQKRAEEAFRGAMGSEGRRRKGFDSNAENTRGRYLGLLEGYDPQEYMQEAAGAVGADLNEQLVATTADNNQALNARGFFGSGINAGRIGKDFNNRLARALASLSLQTAGLEQGRIDRFGRQAETDAGRADYSRSNELDLIAGNRDSEVANRNSRLGGTMGILNAATRFFRPGG